MMAEMRLIDANALLRRIVAEENEIITDNCHAIGLHNGLTLAQAMVINAPTVDRESLRPVGYWIHDVNNLYACSECLERETMSPKKKKPFCPNCGARMKGANND